jgi:uncharacterized Zn finger protein
MCKHVAAVLYGVGARLDHQPDLFFRLRKVDHLELIEEAVSRAGEKTAAKKTRTGKKTLAQSDVAGVFGIELAEPDATEATAATAKPKRGKSGTAKARATRIPPESKPAGKASRSPRPKKG